MHVRSGVIEKMTSVTIIYMGFDELCQCVLIDEDRLIDLIDHGVLTPTSGQHKREWQFSATAVSVVERARRLHQDLAVDWADIPLVLNLLDELGQLRSENAQLKQRLNRFILMDE